MNNTDDDDDYYSIDETGLLVFSDAGLKYYRALFGKPGINIHQITSLNVFNNAIEASEPYLESHIYDRHKKINSLESRTMIAILDGNQVKVDEYLKKLKRKKELSLNILKGH